MRRDGVAALGGHVIRGGGENCHGNAKNAMIDLPFRNKTLILNEQPKHQGKYSIKPYYDSVQSILGLQGDMCPGGNPEILSSLFLQSLRAGYFPRITGALAYDLATMALGEMSIRISMCPKLVDIAAGIPIIQKNGGIATDFKGNEWNWTNNAGLIVATNRRLHANALDIVDKVINHKPV